VSSLCMWLSELGMYIGMFALLCVKGERSVSIRRLSETKIVLGRVRYIQYGRTSSTKLDFDMDMHKFLVPSYAKI